MKEVEWEKFYNEFYNLSGSYQYYYGLNLLSYGTNAQVIEVAKNFKIKDVERTSLFMENAISAGVKFMPYQIIECKELVNKKTLQLVAKKIVTPYTDEQLLLIKPFINSITLHEISKIKESDLPNMQYQIKTIKVEKPSILAVIGVAVLGVKIFNMLTNNEEDK